MHKNSSCAKKLTSVLGVTSEGSCILGFLFGVLKGVDLGVGGECPFVAAPLAFVACEEGEEAATTLRAFLAGDGSGEDSELKEEGDDDFRRSLAVEAAPLLVDLPLSSLPCPDCFPPTPRLLPLPRC